MRYCGVYSSSSSNSSTQVETSKPRYNDRSTRMLLRNKVPVTDLEGIKSVSVSVSGKVSSNIDLSSFNRNTNLFEDDVMSRFYKVPFDKLVMREKARRINEISKMILSCCIDRSQFRESRAEYYKDNRALNISVLNLLDGIRDCLEMKLSTDFTQVANEPCPSVEGDSDGIFDNDTFQKMDNFKLAKVLLGECATNGYNRIVKQMKTFMPSPFILSQTRPNVEVVNYASSNSIRNEENGSQFRLHEQAEVSDEEQALARYSDESLQNSIEGAKITGNYGEYIHY